MKKFLFAALLAVSAAAPAAAQTVNAGTYTVKGTNLDGSSYEGTATITLASETTCVIEWAPPRKACACCMKPPLPPPTCWRIRSA